MGQAQTSAAAAASKRPIVLILGAGYGGVACAKLLDESGLCFVLLVDQKEFFMHTAGTPRALAQRHWAHKLLIPYDKLLKNGCVIHAVVESITPTAVKLRGRTNDLTFDYLVLAMGANYTWPFQTQKRILRQPNATTKELTPKNSATEPAAALTEVAQPIYMMDTLSQFNAVYNQILAAKRIVIVGGGCVGVETAAEIAAAFGSKTPPGSKSAATSSPAVAPITPPNGNTLGGMVSEPYLAEYAAKQQQQAQAPATPPSATAAKEIVLIHSGKDLLNRQTGLRDKMRALALKGLTDAGVQVLLQEKVDLDSVREVRGGGDAEKDVSDALQSRGILCASQGASLRFATIKALAPPADPSLPAPAFGMGGPHEADCILLCTGVKHDSLLYETDPEIRSCLDQKGRLIVNQFFQLEGSVDIERAAASAARGARADSTGRGGPGRTSLLHTQFSFHYPHVFALGDCCVPKEEFKLNLNPQAYYAHKHAQAVARNITNLIQRYALRPYDGSGNASLFLSLGPEHGITQLPNRSQSICGDSQTKAWKSADMHVAANWAFLNQQPNKPSFRGHASQEFVAGEKMQMNNKDATSASSPDADKEEQKEYRAEMASNGAPLVVGAAGVATPITAYAASSTFAVSPKGGYGAEPASPVAAHPNDSAEMSAQAAMVETKLLQMEQDAAAAEAQSTSTVTTVPAGAVGATSPNPRPLGTESLSVAVRGSALAFPKSSSSAAASPSASSPIGPILLADQERKFEEAMAHESDLIDTGLNVNTSSSPPPPPPPPMPEDEASRISPAAGLSAHHSPPRALHLEVDPPSSATSAHVSLNPFASPTAAAASVRNDPFAITPAAAPGAAPASICNPFAPSLETTASSSPLLTTTASTNPFATSSNPFNESPAQAPAAGGNPFASPLNLNASPAAAAVRPLSTTERYNGFALQRQMQQPPQDDSDEGNQQHEYEEA